MLTCGKRCTGGTVLGAGLLSAAARGWLFGNCVPRDNSASGQEAERRGRVAGAVEVLLRGREKHGGNAAGARI
jgi:hypothetical protein